MTTISRFTAGAALLSAALCIGLFAMATDIGARPVPPELAMVDRVDRSTPEHLMLPCTSLLCHQHFSRTAISHIPASAPRGKHSALPWLLAFGLLGVGLTITPVLVPLQPVPGRSYAANVAILTSDASPSVLALPAVFAAYLANYGGPGVPATNAQLKFNITPIALGSAVTVFTASYDGAGNLDISHATGANTSATLYVSVSVPSTNNAP
jgi:hypothetical protein